MTIILVVLVVLLTIALVALGQTPGGLDPIAEAAAHVVKPLVVPVVNLINQPAFAYVASTIVFLSALGVVGWFSARVLVPQVRGMRRARDEIEALRKTAPADWLKASERVHAVLKRHDVLLPSWTLYAAEIVARKAIPQRRFAAVVAEERGVGPQARANFLVGLPGYYTSVGLILTFIGLVVALYFSARGFRSGDTDEARLAIVQLLNASAFKFLTSVAALIGALMISLVHRYGSNALATGAAELATEIDGLLQPLRPLWAEPAEEIRHGQLVTALAQLTSELKSTRDALATLQAEVRERATP